MRHRPTVSVLLAGCLMLGLTGCDTDDPLADVNVSIIELAPGNGDEAVSGATVTIIYIGKLNDGTIIDSTHVETPFMFTIGEERVIRGLERGVQGMRVGGKRRLIIPPQLGFGNTPQGCPTECDPDGEEACDDCTIPANSTLVFDVDLLAVRLP